nr:zinc finger, CCHC-type [Tanacetum cinerariifolium]
MVNFFENVLSMSMNKEEPPMYSNGLKGSILRTCITGSTIESKFVALAAADKEAKWLKNLLIEIPLWVIPITPTYIHCDSVATLAKVIARCKMGNLDT